ncbi:Protein lethal(2)essential for life, partial [Stegodyphus mimosarum]
MNSLPNIVALLNGKDWWDTYDYPARLMDQNFGVGLIDEDLLPPRRYRGYYIRPRTQQCVDSSGQSEVKSDESKFEVMLDVSQFEPDEVDLKIVDNYIQIHAKHDEKADAHGFISREFTRKYMLPDGVEPETVKSTLSENGILKITAPKKVDKPPTRERKVPIILEQAAALE